MTVSLKTVAQILSRHLPVYRIRKPVYQATMLSALLRLWGSEPRRVLDVGGGTGVIAQVINDLFPVTSVSSVDVEDRFLDTLTIATATFDGRTLPFGDESFDCVVFNNVIHHVERGDRDHLLRECKRVAPQGAVFIKDHLATGRLDHLRLWALDVIGNVPFHGMVKAKYLTPGDWQSLAEASGYRIEASESGTYRRGPLALLFPNRLETTMKWQPV